jgi:chromosome segregation ATPase
MKNYLKNKDKYESSVSELDQARQELELAKLEFQEAEKNLVEARAMAYAGDDADITQAEKQAENARNQLNSQQVQVETLERAVSLLNEKTDVSFKQLQETEGDKLRKKSEKIRAEMVRVYDTLLRLKDENAEVRKKAFDLKLNPNAVAPDGIERNIESGWTLNQVLLETAKSLNVKELKSQLFKV